MKELHHEIRERSERIFPWVRDQRRHLHANPELSFEEFRTTNYLSAALETLGVPYTRNGLNTGLVAHLGKGEPAILLRADIDALPIQEKNDVEYCSTNPGVMHACGHDVHTACLLGAIAILKDMTTEMQGSIRCVFQPAEEVLPGGAKTVVDLGYLENPTIVHCFGQHVHPPLEVGKIGYCAGPYMASADTIRILVKGRGGHGALPMNTVDPVLLAANILMTLQQVVSRKANPIYPTALSFGKIQTVGGAFNVIPNEVELIGTFRTLDEEWRNKAHDWIVQMAQHTAMAQGGSCEVDIQKGYPVLVNDETATLQVVEAAKKYLGDDRVVSLDRRLSAEDFAYFAKAVPSSFYRLGTGNPSKGITSPIHTDTFDVDEDCLKVGSGFMAYLALTQLQNLQKA